MSDTPKITFSSVADLNTWSIDGDSKVLVFASPSEAKRAEELFTAIQRELSEALAECERLRTSLLGVKSYREANPLGGPAKVFDAMADCIRAGDSYEAVLKEYGFVRAEECERLRDVLRPSRWTEEQNEAWHKHIPEVHRAFEELLRVTDAAIDAARKL